MKIGLIPMAAKPYHDGHHSLVKIAAQENDEVLVFVSTSDRKRKGEFPLFGEDMLKIWKDELETIMPKNVKLEYGGSPIRKVMEYLISAEEVLNTTGTLNSEIRVYSDPTDTFQNFLQKKKDRQGRVLSTVEKYFPNIYRTQHLIFPAQVNPESFERGVGTADISGTAMRNYLALGDASSFESGLPAELSDDAKSRIFQILSPKKNLQIFGESKDNLILGTEEYSSFLDEIINNLYDAKRSLKSRSKEGKPYRKEASKLQGAIETLRYMSRRNQRQILKNAMINEAYSSSNIQVKDNISNIGRDDIKNFLRRYK